MMAKSLSMSESFSVSVDEQTDQFQQDFVKKIFFYFKIFF